MTNDTRELLIAQLTRDEGLRLTVYDDGTRAPIKPGCTVKGHPTIGIGRALDVRGISPAEAEYLLNNDIDAFELGLRQTFTWFGGLDPIRQIALVNAAFNLGIAGLLGFHVAMEAMAARNWNTAAAAMKDSAWYGQVGARADRIIKMIQTGVSA